MKNSDIRERYTKLAHAVQSGIALCMKAGWRATEPKHLRTGIDLSKSDHGALVSLLISKGVFTEEEYNDALIAALHREIEGFENLYKSLTGIEAKFK